MTPSRHSIARERSRIFHALSFAPNGWARETPRLRNPVNPRKTRVNRKRKRLRCSACEKCGRFNERECIIHQISRIYISVQCQRHGDVFIADSIGKRHGWELVYNAHTALLHRTAFLCMYEIDFGRNCLYSFSRLLHGACLPPASDVSPIFFAHRFVLLSAGLTAVVAATTDTRINIVSAVTRDVPAPTPIFCQRARISSLRQVKLEKIEMGKSETV